MRNFKLILVLLFCSTFLVQAQNKFPLNMPLDSDDGLTLIKYKTSGSGSLPSFSSNGMLMSVDEKSIFTGAYFTDLSFNINRGFVIEFDYEVYTVKGVDPVMKSMGDGFALVLFDAAVTNPTLGTRGSGLGYAYNRNNVAGGNVPGLTGGFLAVGFDTYGHFNQMGTNRLVDWRTGIPISTGTMARYFGNTKSDFVTIRGPVNKALNTYGENKAGYPVLISQNTKNNKGTDTLYYSQIKSDWTNYGESYSKKELNTGLTSFAIAGGVKGAKYPSVSYRKARVEMIPDKTTSGVFYINVSIVVNDILNPMKVIQKYKIDTNSTVKYAELKTAGANDIAIGNMVDPQTMSLAAPSALKLGWTASTGDAYCYTVLKNASVTLPYMPIVMDDVADVCRNTDSYSIFNPLSNDYGYDIRLTEPTPDNAYLDNNSFRFMVSKGSGEVGYNVNDASNPYVYKTSNATYTFDPATGSIKSVVTKSGIASGTTENLYYDIRNLNTTDDEYRSKVATIVVTFGDTNCTVVPVLNNPVAVNDATELCSDAGTVVSIYPTKNDKGYSLVDGVNVQSSSYIDLASFTFTNSSGTALSSTQSATGDNGTYVYNSSTGKLTITRKNTALSSTGKDILYYTVKNKNGTVASNVASITVTFKSSLCAGVPVAEIEDDYLVLCTYSTSSDAVNVISNDTGYTKNSSGVTISGSSYIDKSSFTFTDESGNPTSNPYVCTTSYATYIYNKTTGIVTAEVNVTVGNNTRDFVYYTVRNTGSTERSAVGTIYVVFLHTICQAIDPPSSGNLSLDDICTFSGTETYTDALEDAVGYGVYYGSQVSGKQYIDKNSFRFVNANGIALSPSSPKVQDGIYALYTYDSSTGYITVTVKDNFLSKKATETVYFDVTNLGNSSKRSNVGKLTVSFSAHSCPYSDIWIKINAPRKGTLINGIGDLPSY